MRLASRRKIQIGRELREWYEGAIYHVMQRGIRHMEIFSNQRDYEMFMVMLARELKRCQCKIHAYCLMTNHYHLLLETTEQAVWKFMKNLSHNYAQYYNSVNSYHGHLFEGRYKACLVKDDQYFLQTSRYIHLNPVKAKMVEHAEDYRWSSYRCMLNMGDDNILEREKTMKYFGANGVWGYRDFVEDVAHKYIVTEDEIRKSMGEDDLWLPW